MPGFQSIFRFLPHFVLAKLATISTSVNSVLVSDAGIGKVGKETAQCVSHLLDVLGLSSSVTSLAKSVEFRFSSLFQPLLRLSRD